MHSNRIQMAWLFCSSIYCMHCVWSTKWSDGDHFAPCHKIFKQLVWTNYLNWCRAKKKYARGRKPNKKYVKLFSDVRFDSKALNSSCVHLWHNFIFFSSPFFLKCYLICHFEPVSSVLVMWIWFIGRFHKHSRKYESANKIKKKKVSKCWFECADSCNIEWLY